MEGLTIEEKAALIENMKHRVTFSIAFEDLSPSEALQMILETAEKIKEIDQDHPAYSE